jgi:hypothetical protein
MQLDVGPYILFFKCSPEKFITGTDSSMPREEDLEMVSGLAMGQSKDD